MKTAKQLIEDGEVNHVQLGFDTEPLERKVAAYLGLNHNDGLIVCEVTADSPAAQAGIIVGDVVTLISDTPVHSSCDVITAIEKLAPDHPLSLTLFRDGSTVSIEFSPKPLGPKVLEHPEPKRANQQPVGFLDSHFELAIDNISPAEIKRRGYDQRLKGVVVTYVSPDSIAAKAGICAGMVVLRVGNETVTNLSDYRRAMDEKPGEKGVLLLVATPHQQHFVLLQ